MLLCCAWLSSLATALCATVSVMGEFMRGKVILTVLQVILPFRLILSTEKRSVSSSCNE